jgi:hypothetical protein
MHEMHELKMDKNDFIWSKSKDIEKNINTYIEVFLSNSTINSKEIKKIDYVVEDKDVVFFIMLK